MIRSARLFSAVAALLIAGSARAQAPVAAWVQYVGGTAAEIRAVSPGDRCPEARIDGERREMARRAGPEPGFANTVCALPVPTNARSAAVESVRLTLPKRQVRRILIFGDTGCRVKGATLQACNDPKAWPFPTVARLAAARKPDLVIHVGDYFYRETACPAGESGCAGSPHGDAEPAWDADLFEPARPLLTAAPWVFARGNHESCGRGAVGWFRMLDAGKSPQPCPAVSQPFTVQLDGLALQVVDGADADDRLPSAQGVAAFQEQIDHAPSGVGPRWIITHRPIWGLVAAAKLGPLGILDIAINSTEQQALRGRPLDGVEMVVSGHIHHFATYDFHGARPSQLIVGTGGDIGDKADSAQARAGTVSIDGKPADRYTFYRFGYLLLERSNAGWTGAFHDASDRVAATCRQQGRSLQCRSVPGRVRG